MAILTLEKIGMATSISEDMRIASILEPQIGKATLTLGKIGMATSISEEMRTASILKTDGGDHLHLRRD